MAISDEMVKAADEAWLRCESKDPMDMMRAALEAANAVRSRTEVVVPREPTEAMLIAGHAETPYCHAEPEECRAILGDRTCHEGIRDVYRAMIAAGDTRE